MARTSEQISRQIRANLRILDPDISTEPLTPERKMIDTVAEVMAEAEVDSYVLDYQYDVDTKVGADLDKFVALFGFARQGGRRATGTITFSRATAAERDIVIPAGTQLVKPATSVSPAVAFQTRTTVTMYVGTTTVDAPIESTVVGVIGNVSANQITVATSGVGDVTATTNTVPTTGGSEEETDAELRVRFKNTIFRNIAGTPDQYLALAIASRFAKKANVIGPVSRFSEYLQLLSTTTTGSHTLPVATINVTSTTGFPTSGTAYIGGQAVAYTGKTATTLTGASGGSGVIAAGTIVSSPTVSQIPYTKWSYNFDYYLTDGNPTSETFYTPRGSDYTFLDTEPPQIYVNNATNLPSGKIVLLEHSYASANSRNDPATSVLNYVDVFVSGADVVSASESAAFPPTGNNFVAGTGTYGVQNWRRANDNSVPPTTGRLQELMWQPVEALPTTITIGANTYNLNTHYWFVRDVTVYKGSRRARNGIEWAPAVTAAVTAGTAFQLTYTFDKLPLTLNELMDSHKQVASDVLVHSATERYFKVHLTVMYTPGFATAAVNTAISTALTDFLERMNFGAVIQMSDILDVVHDVPGVDNVRLTSSTEAAAYGVQEVNSVGTNIGSPYTNDFTLQDSDLPVLYSIVTLAKSQNTWSSL